LGPQPLGLEVGRLDQRTQEVAERPRDRAQPIAFGLQLPDLVLDPREPARVALVLRLRLVELAFRVAVGRGSVRRHVERALRVLEPGLGLADRALGVMALLDANLAPL